MRFKYLELGQKSYEVERHYEASAAKILEEYRELKWQNSVLCELVQGYEKGESPPEPWIVRLALQLDDKCENEIRNLETVLAVEKKLEQWNKEGDHVWKNWIKIEEGLGEEKQTDGSEVVDDQVGTRAEKRELGECPRCEQYRTRCARILRSDSLKAADKISQSEAHKTVENAPQDTNEQVIFLQSELERYEKRNVRAEEKVRLLEEAMKHAKLDLPLISENLEEEEEVSHSPQGVAHLRLENIGLRNELDKVQKKLRALESDENFAAVHYQQNKNAEYWQHMAALERMKREHEKKVAELMKESKERHQEWRMWAWAQFKSLTDLNNALRLQIIENQRTLKQWATVAPSYVERKPWINCNPEIYVPSLTLATLRDAEAPVYIPLPVSAFFTPRHPPSNWGPTSRQTPPAGGPPLGDLEQTSGVGTALGSLEAGVNTNPAPPHGIAHTGNARGTRNIPHFGEVPYQPNVPSSGIIPYSDRAPEGDRVPEGSNFPHDQNSYAGNTRHGPTGGTPRLNSANIPPTGFPPYDGLLPRADGVPLSSPSDSVRRSKLSIQERDDPGRKIPSSMKKAFLREREYQKRKYQVHKARLMEKYNDLNSGVFDFKEENRGLLDKLNKAEETIIKSLGRNQELSKEIEMMSTLVDDRTFLRDAKVEADKVKFSH